MLLMLHRAALTSARCLIYELVFVPSGQEHNRCCLQLRNLPDSSDLFVLLFIGAFHQVLHPHYHMKWSLTNGTHTETYSRGQINASESSVKKQTQLELPGGGTRQVLRLRWTDCKTSIDLCRWSPGTNTPCFGLFLPQEQSDWLGMRSFNVL